MNRRVRMPSIIIGLSALLLSTVGCGSSSHDSAVQAQRRQQMQEQRYHAKQTQEKTALKDYNSGS